jgi:hypothetical protein
LQRSQSPRSAFHPKLKVGAFLKILHQRLALDEAQFSRCRSPVRTSAQGRAPLKVGRHQSARRRSCPAGYVHVMFYNFAGGSPMRHLTSDRSARRSGPVASRPRTARKRPHPWPRDLSDRAPDPQHSLPSAFVRTAPKPPPNGTEAPAPSAPLPKPTAATPSAFVRSHAAALANQLRTRPTAPVARDELLFVRARSHPRPTLLRPRTPHGDTPPVASSTGPRDLSDCSLDARRRLRTIRAPWEGGARPAREAPETPPNAQATRRPDLRAPKRPCPFAP